MDSWPPSDLTRAHRHRGQARRCSADRTAPRAPHHAAAAAKSSSTPIADRCAATRWSSPPGAGRAKSRSMASRRGCRSVRCAGSCCRSRGWDRACDASPGPAAATSCRGTMAPCSSAPRWKKPASTNARPSRACTICSPPPARRCRTPGRPAFAARASACGRPPRTACRSSGASDGAPNVMFASGHYRNGVLLAPLTARLVADAHARRPRRPAHRRPRSVALCRMMKILCAEREGRWVAHAVRGRYGRSIRHRVRRRHRARGDRAADTLARLAERPCRGARRVAAGGTRVSPDRFRQRVYESHRGTDRRRDPAGCAGGSRARAHELDSARARKPEA